MRVIPVLDLMAGLAVAAFAGDRDRYGLLRGTPEGCDPASWARRFAALLDEAGQPPPPALYVADLDAIEGRPPHLDALAAIAAVGVAVWVDAGVRRPEDVPPLFEAGASAVIAALETLEGPDELEAIVAGAGADRVVFSLDLRDGQALCRPCLTWGTDDPLSLARSATDRGARSLIVLDLARVGTGTGTGTEALIAGIRGLGVPGLTLIAGGGVAGPDDLDAIRRAGADAVLVGSALRDGRLTAANLRAVAGRAAT